MSLGSHDILSTMGYASNISGPCPKHNRGVSAPTTFSFRKRLERIDWRKIAALDVDQIARDLDFETLQDNVANVAFCNIECEIDTQHCDPNYVKLFRLAQLIIEYLLHSQDYLSHTIVSMEEKCQVLCAELNKEQMDRQTLEQSLALAREEAKKYKKLICTERRFACTVKYTCPLCAKMYETLEHLQSHLKRRHLNPAPVPVAVAAAPQINTEKLEEEIRGLQQCLQVKENEMQTGHKKQCEKFQQEIEQWKEDQLQAHKKELEVLRCTFINEMQEVCRRSAAAEQCIDILQKQVGCIPASQAPKDADGNMLKEQKREFCKMKKHLTELIENAVCQQLKDQEEQLQKRIKCIFKEQNQELDKLNCLVKERMCCSEPAIISDDVIQTLCERTKVQEKLLKQQQRRLKKLYCEQLKNQQQMQIQQQQLQNQQLQQSQPQPSPENKCPEKKKVRRWSDSTCDKQFLLKDLSSRPANDKNSSLVLGLRKELSSLLNEKLQAHGIHPEVKSIDDAKLTRELLKLDLRRDLLHRKYPEYKQLRKKHESLLDEYAKNFENRIGDDEANKQEMQDRLEYQRRQTKSESNLQHLNREDQYASGNPAAPLPASLSRSSSFTSSPELGANTAKTSLEGPKRSLQRIFTSVKKKLSPAKSEKPPPLAVEQSSTYVPTAAKASRTDVRAIDFPPLKSDSEEEDEDESGEETENYIAAAQNRSDAPTPSYGSSSARTTDDDDDDGSSEDYEESENPSNWESTTEVKKMTSANSNPPTPAVRTIVNVNPSPVSTPLHQRNDVVGLGDTPKKVSSMELSASNVNKEKKLQMIPISDDDSETTFSESDGDVVANISRDKDGPGNTFASVDFARGARGPLASQSNKNGKMVSMKGLHTSWDSEDDISEIT